MIRRLFLAAVVVASGLGAVGDGAHADTITEKRAEARRIARQLHEQARKVSVLAEEYNLARLEADRITAGIASATTKLRAANDETKRLRTRLKAQAVDSYVRGGAIPAVTLLVETRIDEDLAIRRQYISTITNEIGDTLDELRAATLTLREQRQQLTAARDAAAAAVDDVAARRADAAAAQDAHERMLAKVEGELAALIAAEERRRAEEEARRVQAELAARKAREEAAASEAAAREAARRTTTTTAATTATTAPINTGGTPDPSAPPPTEAAAKAIEEAKRQLGKPYEYGGSGPDTFDCSGLTSWAWRAGGKSLPHSSQAQYSATARVAFANILPGDLLFFGNPIHHVALYVGDGQMIEAPETGKNVRYASIFRNDYAGAGRVN